MTSSLAKDKTEEKQEYSELQIRVARLIVEHACRSNLEEGAHLKEQELANEFQVSRSPVRGALNYLTEKGVLKRRARKGYFLNQDANTLRTDSIDLSNTSDEKLCKQIAKDWFHNKLPQQFTEAELRRRYNLGRLVLSRILLKLSEDGIIARNAGQGWRFEPTLNTESSHDASFEFRLLIEPAAILLPSFRLDQGMADLCRRHHRSILEGERVSLSQLFEIDAEFHRLIGISCGNPFFLSAIERQSNLRQLVEYESLIETDRTTKSCLEHMDILDAIESGDMNMASLLMKQHLLIASRNKPEFD